MNLDEKISALARYEINWWKGHHRRDPNLLIESTAKQYEILFNVSYEIALKAAELRWKATKEYIKAKGFDGKDQFQADVYWNIAKQKLKEMYGLLCENG